MQPEQNPQHQAPQQQTAHQHPALDSSAFPDRSRQLAEWCTKTSAEILTAAEFQAEKVRLGLHVVGVTGFSGQWSEAKIAGDPSIAADAASARSVLHDYLAGLKARYKDKLVLSSGATMEGVPKIIYEEAAALGIAAMGVACSKAFDYKLGEMKYLVIEGSNWGDESPTFLDTSDELLMLGGGGQAKREAIAADASGKTVTVFRGYKGSADLLQASDLPGGSFIERH